MALHDYLRDPATIAFNNATLLTNIQVGRNRVVFPASVLLRTVALYALTYRENTNANAIGGAVQTPEHLKLFSSYDCLFPFSNNGVSFPAPRTHDNIDLIIANKEFGVVIPPAPLVPTATDYIAFMTAPAGRANNQRGATVANGGTVLGEANGVGGPIPVDDEDMNANNLRDIYEHADNFVNNFYEIVNAAHYLQKKLARLNVIAVRNLGLPANNDNRAITVSLSCQKLSTHIPIRTNGKLDGLVDSWGPYQASNSEWASFQALKLKLRNTPGLSAKQEIDARVIKDLYRYECCREPATLVTNAMCIDLIEFNYHGIHENYILNHIRDRMPMTMVGAVDAVRSIWKHIILAHNAINNHIYYRYDYPSLTRVSASGTEVHTLTKTENNLLFNYIMHQADQLDTVNLGAGNITARLRTNVLTAAIVANQQVALTNNGSNNPWAVVMGPYANGIASIYKVTVPVTIAGANHNIEFEARFRTGAPLVATDIFITSFPLALINQLLLDWYQVDIGLPNQDIQINLQLRA